MTYHATNTVPPLHCEIVENVTLLPMVGDITGKISTYALGAYAKKQALPYLRRMINKDTPNFQLPYVKPWKHSSQEVIYGGIFFMHWGHFLLEDLQRLWYAKEKNLPIVWVGVNGFTHTPSQFKSWQSEIFTALGIHNEHIFLNEPTQFTKVHFPEPGAGINTHLHPQHTQFLGYYEEPVVQGKYVYFSRSKIRGCTNEEHLEAILKKRGWHIIHPESLSVTEQLKAMTSAEVCFMIGGSAQHTLLLTKSTQTRYIVIPREHTETFNLIANSKSDNYFLFHLPKTVLYSDYRDEANNLFTLDLPALEDILEKTQNFTQNTDDFPQLFIKPRTLSPQLYAVPDIYYSPIPTPNKAQKLFYHAFFLYQNKKYRAAYTILMYLQKKNLLEDFMYLDFLTVLQQYHLQCNVSITLPLKKYRWHVRKLQEKIASTPQHTASYEKLTELYLIAGNFAAALQTQELLMQRNPQWSKPVAQIASIYAAQNKNEKALEFALKAAEVEPHNLQRKAELARYLLAKQDFTACKKLLTQALLQNATWDEGYVHLATMHYSQGELDKAIACIQKAVSLAPTNLDAQEQWAMYLQQKGRYTEAIQILAKALQDNPRHAARHAQNAHFYAYKGQWDQAINSARKAVEMEPRNFVCKAQLATYLVKNKEYTAAKELMLDAMHKNPFWSEPHAQFATIYDAQGQLDKAIDCARKAVAVEPYDAQRKEELHYYRSKKFQLQQQNNLPPTPHKYSTTWARIQSYIDIFYAQTYLEIGVENGHTFLNLDVPLKMGVDPAFLFDTHLYATEHIHFYSETSDIFFEKLPQRLTTLVKDATPFTFDIIFIDGLHTFAQTLRDFENSLTYAHQNTIWIIDDTVPSSVFSAMDCQEKQKKLKDCAGINKETDWHGDVYKVIFALHDHYPEFSYCTQTNRGNPQTIVWRTKEPTPRQKIFNSLEAIAPLGYEDFLEYAWLMHPVNDDEVLGKIFTAIDPLAYKTGEEYKKVIRPFITDQERVYKKHNEELQKNVMNLSEKQENMQKEIHKLQEELVCVHQQILALTVENAVLKKKLQNEK